MDYLQNFSTKTDKREIETFRNFGEKNFKEIILVANTNVFIDTIDNALDYLIDTILIRTIFLYNNKFFSKSLFHWNSKTPEAYFLKVFKLSFRKILQI